MYWFDKWLILRVYKTPVNYDEKPILKAISMMKWAFLFHFVWGFQMITYDGILSSDNQVDSDEKGFRFFDSKRYTSSHAVAFFTCSCIIISIVIAQTLSEDFMNKIMLRFAHKNVEE
jgi:hypothetical protein